MVDIPRRRLVPSAVRVIVAQCNSIKKKKGRLIVQGPDLTTVIIHTSVI